MKILGLDMGSKRIGLAVSDEDETFAFPRGKLDREGRDKDLAALARLIEEEAIEHVVVGVPLHMSGRQSKGAEAARTFAKALAAHVELPVDTLDERLTTVEAERALHATGRRAKDQREVVDAVAASIILSTYLDLRRNREQGSGDT
ncbi:MAG: Holliday junction resolvase RuvX [Myxococcota bacterium]|jgi:putative Holliday junction resolvase|nr:Holliday junction resolvase RuvX [Myxococcota bacterium]